MFAFSFPCKPTKTTFTMEVRIAIFQKGVFSTYMIRRINDTTAFAYLVQNKGSISTPEFIRLSKQKDQWTSAYPDAEIIKEFDSAIENNFSDN
jgi:hypothetical protein